MSKKVAIIVIVLVLVLVAGLFWYFSREKAAEPTAPPTQIVTPPPPLTPPTDDSIVIQTPRGNVAVNNFYKTAAYVGTNFVAIQDKGDYFIDYNRHDGSFLIQLLIATRKEAIDARARAEAEFLQKLGISQDDACKLEVSLTIPIAKYFPNLFHTGDYGLSFCPGSRAI